MAKGRGVKSSAKGREKDIKKQRKKKELRKRGKLETDPGKKGNI